MEQKRTSTREIRVGFQEHRKKGIGDRLGEIERVGGGGGGRRES